MDDIEAIKQLKGRYCRTMDTKDWEAMRQVFADKLPGKDADQPQAGSLDYLRSSKTLVVHSLDRLSRSLAYPIAIVGTLLAGVVLRSVLRVVLASRRLRRTPRRPAPGLDRRLVVLPAGAVGQRPLALVQGCYAPEK